MESLCRLTWHFGDLPCRKRKGGGGYSKKNRLSPALATFLGVDEESRPQVVKKIWDYIKANNLQASLCTH